MRRDVTVWRLGRAGSPSGAGQETKRVTEAAEDLRWESLAISQLLQARPQREQVAGQVPAVNGGNIKRRKRPQRRRVVPVVEVAADPLHPLHRLESARRPLYQAAGGDVTEVIRSQVGEE